MPYWRLFYHTVWSTRRREPLIRGDAEETIVRSFRTTGHEFDMFIHAVGLMPDHVHLATSIPPCMSVAAVVGRLKEAASHAVNSAGIAGDATFAWQSEYGVLSFGERALPDVIAYVQNQQERHYANNLWPAMERTADRSQPA